MKPLPFRFKIAFLSLMLSGSLLVGFGIFFLAIMHRVGVDRVDREIKALAEGQLHGWHPPDHWKNFDDSLRFVYGEDSSTRIAMKVLDAQGRIVFTSPDCPLEISDLSVPELEFRHPPSETPTSGLIPPADRPLERLARESGQRFVERLDRDGDGQVSPAEFDGPTIQFPELDRDGDGYLSALEAPLVAPRQRDSRSPQAWPAGRPSPPRQRLPVFLTLSSPTDSWRVGVLGNDLVTLTIGLSLVDLNRETARFRQAFLLATPIALLGLAIGGWWIARRALRPVTLITETAESISAHELDRRVPVTATDAELRRLVEMINGMLDRLESSFHQAMRFSSDAAHELQTPLTVLQGELDNAIQSAATGSEQQQIYGGLLEEVQRLKAVVRKLLILARADAGQLALELERLDLSTLLRNAIEDAEAMHAHVQIESDIQSRVSVWADSDLLGQLVVNLVSNALKYKGQDARIRFELAILGEQVRFRLGNTGTSIASEDRERIFDRFYRVDSSRSREAGGSGLGLSLAREIAHAHGGELRLEPADLEMGEMVEMTVFTLILPLGRDTRTH